jgi:hypothetical protein
MERKQKKIYIEYICPRCKKNFGNLKYHYNNHINKKNPCIILSNTNDKIEPNSNNINLIDDKIEESNNDKMMINLIEKIDLLIKQNEEQKIEIIKLKEEYKEDIKKIKDELKEDIKKLKEENEKIKNQLIISNNNNNQPKTNINIVDNININIQLNNFGSIDYNSLDKKLFIDPILNQIGKQIFLKMIKNVYINQNLPKNHNLVITDKNRGYVKKYIDGKWETDNLKLINLLVNEIVEHSKVIYDELKEKFDNNNKIKNKLNTAKKYIDLCDIEFLAELEENIKDEDNKEKIKRCKEFYEMVYKGTINLFHDNKELLTKNKK